MKLRFRFDPPPLDKAARLPLCLALALAAALGVQLLAPLDADPPTAGAVAGGARARVIMPQLAATGVDPVILSRAMFAPVSASSGGQTASPLGGYSVEGSVRVGRRAYAVVRAPDQRTLNVRVGGRFGGWRLSALTENAAILARGGERLTVPFGTQPPTSSNGTTGETS